MNDITDKGDLAIVLAKALKQYAPHASIPERTAVNHLAEQLANSTGDVDFRIQRVKGRLTVECFPISYTTSPTDTNRARKRSRKTT